MATGHPAIESKASIEGDCIDQDLQFYRQIAGLLVPTLTVVVSKYKWLRFTTVKMIERAPRHHPRRRRVVRIGKEATGGRPQRSPIASR
jgi:hypothetical protein